MLPKRLRDVLVVIPLLFLLAYLYPYLPAHDIPWCAIKIGTGIDCPGCGMVRSVSALLHGDVPGSLKMHPFGVVVVGWLAWLWIKRIRRIYNPKRYHRERDREQVEG